MVSNRYRANQSLTNKVVQLDSRTKLLAKKRTATSALPTSSSVVSAEQIPDGTIGTPQLGVVNEFVSDSNLLHSFPADAGIQVSGGVYAEAIEEGGYAPIVMDGNGVLRPYPSAAGGMRAILDPEYAGEGPARVIFWGTTSVSLEAYQWMTPYQPWRSRVVTVEWRGGTWVITGQTAEDGYGGRITLPLANNWTSYNVKVSESDWAYPTATRLHSGIVVLSGLISYEPSAVPSADTLIATLPEGMRPDTDMLHYVNQSDTAKAMRILANGQIQVSGSGWTSGGYVSFDGIAFPAAGVATWTDIGSGGSTWGANFEAWTATTNWGTPAYWKDPYGFVWFRGLVRVKTATSGDNTNIAVLPAAYRANLEQHFRTTGQEGYAAIGAQPGNGINWKTNSPGSVGNWISLSSAFIVTTDALNDNPWVDIEYYVNSWGQHTNTGTTFPVQSLLRREDGLCTSKGLIAGGTLGTGRAVMLPRELWPENGRLIIDTVTNSVRGRIDISGLNELDNGRKRGGLSVVNGSNTWVSLDGIKWAV